MNRQLEREEEYLEEQLNNGEISLKEFNAELNDLYRSYRAEAEEAAQNAYAEEMGRW